MDRNKSVDFLDELFEKHLNDEQFINTSINDFAKIVKDSINEEAKKNGYNTLGDMIQGEIKSSVSSNTQNYDASTKTKVMKDHYQCRYDYFIDAMENHAYVDRHRVDYKEGYLKALQDMLNLAEMHRNNLCAMEKIVDEQLKKAPSTQDDRYASGYIDGLKFAQRCLLQSKFALMEEINNSLKQAIRKGKGSRR